MFLHIVYTADLLRKKKKAEKENDRLSALVEKLKKRLADLEKSQVANGNGPPTGEEDLDTVASAERVVRARCCIHMHVHVLYSLDREWPFAGEILVVYVLFAILSCVYTCACAVSTCMCMYSTASASACTLQLGEGIHNIDVV